MKEVFCKGFWNADIPLNILRKKKNNSCEKLWESVWHTHRERRFVEGDTKSDSFQAYAYKQQNKRSMSMRKIIKRAFIFKKIKTLEQIVQIEKMMCHPVLLMNHPNQHALQENVYAQAYKQINICKNILNMQRQVLLLLYLPLVHCLL